MQHTLVQELLDLELSALLTGNSMLLEHAYVCVRLQVAVHIRLMPVTLGLSELSDEVINVAAAADLRSRVHEVALGEEGAISDIDVDDHAWLALLVESHAARSEDALEGLNTTAEREALLAAGEEALLDYVNVRIVH